jgi:hypothetical protein
MAGRSSEGEVTLLYGAWVASIGGAESDMNNSTVKVL